MQVRHLAPGQLRDSFSGGLVGGTLLLDVLARWLQGHQLATVGGYDITDAYP